MDSYYARDRQIYICLSKYILRWIHETSFRFSLPFLMAIGNKLWALHTCKTSALTVSCTPTLILLYSSKHFSNLSLFATMAGIELYLYFHSLHHLLQLKTAISDIHAKPCCWAQFKWLMSLKVPSSRNHRYTGLVFYVFLSWVKFWSKQSRKQFGKHGILIRFRVLWVAFLFTEGLNKNTYTESSHFHLWRLWVNSQSERSQGEKSKRARLWKAKTGFDAVYHPGTGSGSQTQFSSH